jgi:hypothetical protein
MPIPAIVYGTCPGIAEHRFAKSNDPKLSVPCAIGFLNKTNFNNFTRFELVHTYVLTELLDLLEAVFDKVCVVRRSVLVFRLAEDDFFAS